jgi:hypothetical protein
MKIIKHFAEKRYKNPLHYKPQLEKGFKACFGGKYSLQPHEAR